jgi:hypothetical protein
LLLLFFLLILRLQLLFLCPQCLFLFTHRVPGFDIVKGVHDDLCFLDVRWFQGTVGSGIRIDALHAHQVEHCVADHLAKDCVLFVKVDALSESDEELGVVGVTVSIGHGYQPSVGELQPLMKLIFEGTSIDGLAPSSSASGITALYHEARNDSMEDGVIVVSLHAQLDEVPTSQRSLSRPQFYVKLTMTGVENDLASSWRLLHVVIAHLL